jgi:lipopolysaccharide transport system ATP-binding protein
MDKIITIEGLGKKYRIKHQKTDSYATIRDTIVNGLKNIFSAGKTNSSTVEEFWALKDVSFSVNRGERIGIIGKNGAGKSTLLKILSRVVSPTSGRAVLEGKIASLLEVGTGFHPELTGRENIFLNGVILGMSKKEIRKKFDEIVVFSEIEKFLDTPVKRYSSGMFVRLAFSVAAHMEPDILIIDEVLSVGDASFQKKSMDKMKAISKNEGRTILFVSHNLPAMAALCQRAVYFEKGVLKSEGNADDIIKEYLDISAAQTNE